MELAPLNHTASYRLEGGSWLIELKLREVRQMFHHLDPAPFREKDLDPAAEQYIEAAVREIGVERQTKLLIHLPAEACDTDDARTLPAAIAHYFDYRALQSQIELHRLLRRGLAMLAIGLLFLFACLSLRSLLAGIEGDGMIAEGLLIIGWVALWRPVETFLYDWWPVLRQKRRFEAMAQMPVQVLPETTRS
jgi:hypothetical protein